MAKCKPNYTVSYTLELTADEAEYLTGLLQDDPYQGHETEEGKIASRAIFSELELARREL